jgi:hypothetical protein
MIALKTPHTQMSSQAKSWLSDTVRELRARLLKDLGDGLESRFRLAIPASRAELDEERRRKRRRLEEWLDEQARSGSRGQKETLEQARRRHLDSAIRLAAATWLNRLIVLGQVEALGLVRTQVFTGGAKSKGFREFRDFGPALVLQEDEGFPLLLSLVFDELALDLPGLFGRVGMTELIPMPVPTLRYLVETLQAPALSEADRHDLWRDDTLLGWVYQFWNDPDREALDQKINAGGKIENHELAAKTQLFTDRYMVEWLLQNSLGQIWLEMCQREGWTADVVATGTLAALEKRREEWRGRRERGEVDEEPLMPLETDLEERWKYYVPRPVAPGEGVPARLSDLRLLDPACGSGHFLVIAFDLLVPLYQEEARHWGQDLSLPEIARSIVENNLHGIDIDPRAVQMAAAAIWLKARSLAPRLELGRMNLVSSQLGLSSLPKDDPALLELFARVEEETGVSRDLTHRLVELLKGADYLGSLLKVGDALGRVLQHQAPLLAGREISVEEARSLLLTRLEDFVSRHSSSEDLGLRLRGEQLAAGVRFLRMIQEDQYHLVVGNPPYQSKSKLESSKTYESLYPEGKSDFFAGFMQRAQVLTRKGGFSGLATLSNWMSLTTYEELRKWLLQRSSLVALLDLGKAAFSACDSTLISVCLSLWRVDVPPNVSAIAIRPIPPNQVIRDLAQHRRLQREILLGTGRFDFHPDDLRVVPGQPLIYWWSREFLERYGSAKKLREESPARMGVNTGDNTRFIRLCWEVRFDPITSSQPNGADWPPLVKGAAGKQWFEPLTHVVAWRRRGLELKVNVVRKFDWAGLDWKVANSNFYFQPGIAFSMIGASFSARAHRFRSVFGDKGSSVFPTDIPGTLCLMNSSIAKYIMESLNPTVSFQVGDVNRLPLFPIESADEIVATLAQAFTQHEEARETSVEFKKPGHSPWVSVQKWAQAAVDRPPGAPLPKYQTQEDPPDPLDEMSYQLGKALGRFDQTGIATAAPKEALPHGILFLSASGGPDSLEHPATVGLREHRTFLREKFFAEDHLKRYEKRPIYFPLSSSKKNFVAWCSIHRWNDTTLHHLLVDHLVPEQNRLIAELQDATAARTSGDKKSQVAATRRHDQLQTLLSELQEFIRHSQDIAERGAPPACPTSRQVDAPFRMDLDDGVMINSAALWPLLLPQWKDPKTWWAELCEAKGKKDYDWSHLAARYFPTRVDKKCQSDPSLAVAHGLFWKYHPEKAYQWELRLQSPEELGPHFRLEEPGGDAYRTDFERQHPDKVQELQQAEQRRRERKSGQADSDQGELDFQEDGEEF